MTRRPGVTLMEVLVAIMIVGVGLLALLTLFPLGALEMARSVQNDKMGHAKHNATNLANILGVRLDNGVQQAMLTPGGGLTPANSLNAFGQVAFPDAPSYPVFVDPVGFNFPINAAAQNWLSGVTMGIGSTPRRVTCAGQIVGPLFSRGQLFGLNVFLDEILFPRDPDLYPNVALGTPCPPSAVAALSSYERSARYSWAFMVQMPQVRMTTHVDLNVILYSGRPLDNTSTLGENTYQTLFRPGTGDAVLSFPGAPPEIAVGNWIIDASMVHPSLPAAAGLVTPRANFHRVVGVTQQYNAGTGLQETVLDLQPPPRASRFTPPANYLGLTIVLDNVLEVYNRGTY